MLIKYQKLTGLYDGAFTIYNLKSCLFVILITVDREAVQELDAKLKEERKQSGEMVLSFKVLYIIKMYRIPIFRFTNVRTYVLHLNS